MEGMEGTMGLSFGHDCEVFLATEDGRPYSPVRVLPRSKVVQSIGEQGGVNRDGMAFEFNPTPSSNPMLVDRYTRWLIDTSSKVLVKSGLHIISSLAVDIKDVPEELVHTLPEDVYEMGCLPDLDAYEGKERYFHVNGREYTKRFAGGHIALGHEEFRTTPTDEIAELVKLFDAHAGLYSIRFSTPDSLERRQTYGTAGAFRHKSDKGIVEYRTPDAGWLWGNAFDKMCSRMTQAYVEWKSGIRLVKHRLVVQAINTCDKELAEQLLGGT